MGSETHQIRRTTTQLEKLLTRLDSTPTSGAAKRLNERFTYRSKTVVSELLDPSSGWNTYRTPTRNISSHGVSILVGKFVYPGTKVRVHLVTVNNHMQTVPGVVRHCRYLTDTATIHELGIEFDDPIDIEMFHRGAARFRILLVDDDDAVHQLVPRMLSKLNIELMSARDGAEAVEMALANDFDVILMDRDMPNMDGLSALKELRSKGYWRPIVALTACSTDEENDACISAGFSDVLNKPFQRQQLNDILVAQKDQPILSSMCDQEDMIELIDQFVHGLPDAIAKLEAAYASEQLEDLQNMARKLKGDAGTYGFRQITDTASDVEQQVNAGEELKAVRTGLNQLIRLCAAARPVRSSRPSGTSEAESAADEGDDAEA